MDRKKTVAVLIPCRNEGLTVAEVIREYHEVLPFADIYVCDNLSSDDTYDKAKATGLCKVGKCNVRGKGAAIRRMLSTVDADIYVMVDGDLTYPALYVSEMVDLVARGTFDIVLGDRSSGSDFKSKQLFHGFGNKFVVWLVNKLFKADAKDVMTGLRVFSRRFAKDVSLTRNGFELETEMTIYAADNGFKTGYVPIECRERPDGSKSKIHTISDGFKIVMFILWKYVKKMSNFQ